MSRILVTGGAGFVGSYVVDRLLACGERVAVVDDLSTGTLGNLRRAAANGLRDKDVQITDICSADAAAWIRQWRPDVVMHLAAQASVARSVADPLHDARVNVVGTLNVLDAAVRASASKVVFASSGGTIYGEAATGDQAVAEDQDYRPLSPYGLSKVAGNHYLELYAHLFGLTSTVLALGNVYGPRQGDGGTSGVVAEFVAALQAGARPVIYGDGSKSRDFVYVDDVAEAFALAATKGDGEVLNVGTGVATPIREVLATVCETMKTQAEPDWQPDQPGEVHRSVLDPTRARDILGWAPRVTLSEGVRRVVDAARGADRC